ncbi:indolepyruvate oxidoreductase subunit beta family protein [Bordetella genomosp. 12]|uniref:Indolepyruvate oxidoreductase subunit B n=1 Tax=Bordetella genomosp. 12 TaxID=463035 RepID=A0A261VUN7_9BORD|nr:indolepyruvate oxidoreductase subunit beta family protein [Bordetella genomosp. 12]OZI77818.1 indolepyruvate oxidoreductase subunit B [Bordetella genomosp. 12]
MTAPVTILIAALGGEGGGVLADWIIAAATAQDYPVQSTSVPGVAQRTGATNYYLEILPVPRAELGGREPVFSLVPYPGDVSIVAASELVEAGRMLQGGYVHPQKTVLVASTHREYAVSEKSAMGDGRYDGARVTAAAATLAHEAILFDMAVLAARHRTVINTVLFGAMAGSGALPFDRSACEAAIRQSGKAVEASLAGFAAGYDRARGDAAPEAARPAQAAALPSARVAALPAVLREVAGAGAALVQDYQDRRYADLYLDRVERMLQDEQAYGDAALDVSRETARYLALWMSYEDVIRVADLKTRRERLARVRREVGAGQGEPLHVTEFLKPGLDEVCSVLPAGLAGWLRRRLTPRLGKRGMGLHVRTSTVSGFALLCLLRSLRRWRPRTERYLQEQALIERWLHQVRALLPLSPSAALELALCGNLVKGYGETSERGHRNLGAILDDAQQTGALQDLPARIAAARRAALADPQGKALARALDLPDPPMIEQPLRFVRKAASS